MKKLAYTFVMFIFLSVNSNANASFESELKSTLFYKIGKEKNIDPVLLYAVALAESGKYDGKGHIMPWLWTIRSENGPYYASSKKDAEKKLAAILVTDKNIDIGMMQLNQKWNSQHDAFSLLDFEKNLTVASDILVKTIKSSPDDIELGIGRYHSWTEERARRYGRKVIAIYENLKQID